MNTYMYSAENNAFIPKQFVDDYVAAGWDLDSLKDVSDDIYNEFRSDKEGFTRAVGDDDLPLWVPLPPPVPPAREELIQQTDAQKQSLMAEAGEKISVLQDAVDLEMTTPGEESALKEWKIYRVLLSRVDTSLGAGVVWPTPPVSPAR